jgi:hypothetical protein
VTLDILKKYIESQNESNCGSKNNPTEEQKVFHGVY